MPSKDSRSEGRNAIPALSLNDPKMSLTNRGARRLTREPLKLAAHPDLMRRSWLTPRWCGGPVEGLRELLHSVRGAVEVEVEVVDPRRKRGRGVAGDGGLLESDEGSGRERREARENRPGSCRDRKCAGCEPSRGAATPGGSWVLFGRSSREQGVLAPRRLPTRTERNPTGPDVPFHRRSGASSSEMPTKSSVGARRRPG